MIDPDRIGIDSFLLEGVPETAPERELCVRCGQPVECELILVDGVCRECCCKELQKIVWHC